MKRNNCGKKHKRDFSPIRLGLLDCETDDGCNSVEFC